MKNIRQHGFFTWQLVLYILRYVLTEQRMRAKQ